MKSILVLTTVFSHTILISMLIWLISLCSKLIVDADPNIDKKENFECGFENTSIGDNAVAFKGAIIFMFLLVYDLELLLLLPVMANIRFLNTSIYIAVGVVATIAYSCYADIEFETLEYDN